ncbi:MAG: glutamine-hydrolyzing GMP synthase [Flavobacteriales bacterium]|nr:glutamine-hydrolyzing GMP synthase [Flavobacteriales bacterium]
MHQKLLIIDFGSQYTQLIARRVRELNVYCEIWPYNHLPSLDGFQAVILSGSPHSVRERNAPTVDLQAIFANGPVLGVCYGAQLIAQKSGGTVEKSATREYGRANLNDVSKKEDLFKGIKKGSQVWMSHGDTIFEIPENFKIIASTHEVKVAAFKVKKQDVYGVQFHPEVYHSEDGTKLLGNFLYKICGFTGDWTPGMFVEETVAELKNTLKKDKVIMALSGGVDSTVAASLISKAIGKNLHCIFVDNGLLRKGEFESVLHSYKDFGLNVKGVDAKARFMKALKGVSDPEKKRKIIGGLFIEIFDEESKKIKDAKWLGQGTIYPDVIESVSVKGPSATIKSHHNVGGLPAKMKLKVVEPLRTLFKDEVRRVGRSMGIGEDFIGRHPFPGPGLAIRILGDITPEKAAILQEADFIYINALKKHGLYDEVWQAGAIFLPVQSVGVMGDERTYENAICLRAVTSTDGMTADWSRLPYDFLAQVSNEIINKVKGVNRVVFDISSKPPATIEWE